MQLARGGERESINRHSEFTRRYPVFNKPWEELQRFREDPTLLHAVGVAPLPDKFPARSRVIFAKPARL